MDNPADLFRSDVILGAKFEVMDEPHRIPNRALFNEIMYEIQDEAKKIDMFTDIKDPVTLVLGPEQIQKFLEMNTQEFLGASCYLLTSRQFPSSTLLVSTEKISSREAVRRLETEFQNNDSDPLDINAHEFMIHLETGKPPMIVKSPYDSHLAIVEQLEDIPSGQNTKEYYEKITGKTIVSTRMLTKVEKKSMRNKGMKIENLDTLLRLLEFKSVSDRNQAASSVPFTPYICTRGVIFKPETFVEMELKFMFSKPRPDLLTEVKNLMVQAIKDSLCTEEEVKPHLQPDRFIVKDRNTVVIQINHHYIGKALQQSIVKAVAQRKKNKNPPKLLITWREMVPVERDVRDLHENDIDIINYVSRYGNVRMREEWSPGEEEDIGLLVMEGSNLKEVQEKANNLRISLTPKSCDDLLNLPMFFYGIGEAYARSVAYRCGLLLDIDKFNGKLFMGPGCQKLFVLLLSEACHGDLKQEVQVEVDIIIAPNFHNHSYLLKEKIHVIAKALGASCQFEGHKIAFKGSWEAYELLTKELNEITDIIHNIAIKKFGIDQDAQCPICFSDNIGDRDFFRPGCGHSVCRECCNDQIRHMLKLDDPEKFKVDCQKCGIPWSFSAIVKAILGDSRRIRSLDSQKLEPFVKAVKRAVVKQDPNLDNCPENDCRGIVLRDRFAERAVAECSNDLCNHRFCKACLDLPHQGRCGEADELAAQQLMEQFPGQFKKCPSCKKLVEKDGGCFHVACRCSKHFCWLCSELFESAAATYKHLTEQHGQIGNQNPFALPIVNYVPLNAAPGPFVMLPLVNPIAEIQRMRDQLNQALNANHWQLPGWNQAHVMGLRAARLQQEESDSDESESEESDSEESDEDSSDTDEYDRLLRQNRFAVLATDVEDADLD